MCFVVTNIKNNFYFSSRYGLIMPKKLPQKNLASKKLSVFDDDSDEEVSSTIFFCNVPHLLQIICSQPLIPASACGDVTMTGVIRLDLGVLFCSLFHRLTQVIYGVWTHCRQKQSCTAAKL